MDSAISLNWDSNSGSELFTAAQLAADGLPGNSQPQLDDSEGNPIDQQVADLTPLYDQQGNYVGAYGFDPSTGYFSAWDAQGNETSLQALVQSNNLAASSKPVDANGQMGLLYNAQGQLLGVNVAAFVNNVASNASNISQSITGLVQVSSSTGALLGSFGAYGADTSGNGDGAFGIWTSDGTYIDATQYLEGVGFSDTQIGDALDAIGNSLGAPVDDPNVAAIQTSLTQYFIAQNGWKSQSLTINANDATITPAASPSGAPTVVDAARATINVAGSGLTALYDADGNFVATYGVDPSTGYFSSWDSTGTETNLNSLVAKLGAGESVVSGNGQPGVLYNASGQVTGINVAGFTSSLTAAQTQQSMTGMVQVRDASGNILGSFGAFGGPSSNLGLGSSGAYAGISGNIGLWDANGNYTDATTLLESLGLNDTQIGDAVVALSDPINSGGANSADAQAVIQALTSYLISANGDTPVVVTASAGVSGTLYNAADNPVAAASLTSVYDANGHYVASYGIDASTGYFSSWNAAGHETDLRTLVADLRDFTSPVAPDGSVGISYDDSGNIVGLNIAGFAASTGARGVVQSGYYGLTSLTDVSGRSLGAFGVANDTNFVTVDASGTQTDATALLQSLGLSTSQIASAKAWLDGSSNTQASQTEAQAVGEALAQHVLWANTAEPNALTPQQVSQLSTAQLQALTISELQGFSVAQIAALAASQVCALSADQLASLSSVQIRALSHSAIGSLTATQITALGDEQFSGLSASQVGALSNSQIAALSTDQIGALLPSQTSGLSAAQLQVFSAQQIPALGAGNIGAFNANQLESLTSAFIGALSPGQVGGFTAGQLAQFSGAQMDALTPTDISMLDPNALAGLNWWQVASLTSSQVSAITDPQIFALDAGQVGYLNKAALSAEQVSAINGQALSGGYLNIALLSDAQLGALTTAQAPSLTAQQIRSLSTGQLAALSTATITALSADALAALGTNLDSLLSPAAIATLSASSVTSLTAAQLSGLSSAQVASLSADAISAFSGSQVAALSSVSELTTSEINSLSTDQVGDLTASQIESLAPIAFASFGTEQIAALSSSQLSAVSAAQIAAISAEQVASLSFVSALSVAALQALDQTQIAALQVSQLSQLSASEVANLTGVQVTALDGTQVASLTMAQVSALSARAVANLQSTAISALSTSQLQTLSSDQLNALSTGQISALSSAQVQSLTQTQLSGLEGRWISSLSTTQVQSLTTTQVGELESTQIQGLTTAQLKALTSSQLGAVTQGQASSFRGDQVEALSQGQLESFQPTVLATLIEPLTDLGVTSAQPGTAPYTGPDSVSAGGTIVAGSVTGQNAIVIDNADGSQSDVSAIAGALPDGSFSSSLTGGTQPTATGPTASLGPAVIYTPITLQSNQILLNGTPFTNLVATADANGDGWYRVADPSNVNYQISYDPSSGQWDFSNPFNGTGVWAAGLSGRDSYYDAFNSYQSYYGIAPASPLPSNQIVINGAPFNNLVGTTTGDGWYYASDPFNSAFAIGYNASTHAWDFENTATGNGVVSNQLLSRTIRIPPELGGGTETVPVNATSYSQAYGAYQTAFGDAPTEAAPASYTAVGLTVAPSDGTHIYASDAPANALLGGTGLLTDTDDTSVFAPLVGSTAAVIGNTGSISQTLNGLTAGQWYAVSFSAMTTVLEEAAQYATGNVNLGLAAAAPQEIQVSIDGQSLGVFSTGAITDLSSDAGSPWQQFASAAFVATSGPQTLTFQGLAPGGATSSLTLDNLQLLAVTPTNNPGQPSGGIASLSPSAIGSLTPQQLLAASDSDLQSLNAAQFAAITPTQLSYFWGAAINRFSASQLEGMSAAQISGLGADQVSWLSSTVVNAFAATQLQACSSLASLSIATLQQLTASTISAFSADQIATLGQSQFAVLTPTQIQCLNSGAWSLFSATQLYGFSAYQLAAVSDSELASISTAALAGLPTVESGTSLPDFLSTPSVAGPDGEVPTQDTAGALATALTIYDEDAPGATPDFAKDFGDSTVAAGAFDYDDANTGATFTGTAGITADGSALSVGNDSTDGDDAAFIQGAGTFSETISGLAAGQSYQIAFNSAQAPGSSEQVEVLVDGVTVGSFDPGASYNTDETDAFTVNTSGPHVVTFQGLGSVGGQSTALVDSLHIALAGDATVLSGGAILNDGGFVDASSGILQPSTSPSPSPWLFSGDSGIAGPQSAAFLANGGSVSQVVGGFQQGETYSVAFDAAQAVGSDEAIQVLVDGVVVDTVAPSDGQYRLQSTATFCPGGGSHTISFVGLSGSGSALITNVRVLACGLTSDAAAIQNGSLSTVGGGWAFGAGTGIAPDQQSIPSAPSGVSAAFLQGGGSFSQDVDDFQLNASYALSFRASQGAGPVDESINVLVDGTVVGTFTPGSQYSTYTTSIFVPGPGTHRVSFEGVGPDGATALINDVELVLLPQPATSAFVGDDGETLLGSVPDQDELQRLQWASLTASSELDQASANGGDDMLSVSPNTDGISATPGLGSPATVHLGWSANASNVDALSVSAASASVTETLTSSDGTVVQWVWSLIGSDPSSFSSVTQTQQQTAATPHSANGSLPVSASMTSVISVAPTSNTVVGVGSAHGATSYNSPPPLVWPALSHQLYDSTPSGIAGQEPKTNGISAPLQQNVTLPGTTTPFTSQITISNKDLTDYINYLYENSPSFATMWNALLANGTTLTIGWEDLDGAAGGETAYNPTGGSQNIQIGVDPIDYSDPNAPQALSVSVIEANISHEVDHAYTEQQLWAYANWGAAPPMTPDSTPQPPGAATAYNVYAGFVAAGGLVDLGFTGPGSPDWVNLAINEFLAYTDSMLQAIVANGNNANNITVTAPNANDDGGTASAAADKAFLTWAAQQLGLNTTTMLAGGYSIDSILQNVLQLYNDKVRNNPTLLSKLVAKTQAHVAPTKPPTWISAQNRAMTADAFVNLINDLQKGGLDNDLITLAAALKLAGLLPNIGINIQDAAALSSDSQFVSLLGTLLAAYQKHDAQNGFAAASAVASTVAQHLVGGAGSPNPGGGAAALGAISSVLGDISAMFSGNSGTGTLTKDLQYFKDAVNTDKAIVGLFPRTGAAQAALGKLAFGVGDVVSIVEGFDEGGPLGGIQAGYSADALAQILGVASSLALPIGIAIGLAALFFGGNHDNPATMPDKYDTQNYGQGVANLQGRAGANSVNFTENTGLETLFGGRTGIQAIEETLAIYTSESSAPNWLRPIFNQLEGMFGESTHGTGTLSIGNDGSGKDCNNQEIVGVSDLNQAVYQYTQLDAALNEFQTAYGAAVASGQASAMSWDTASTLGTAAPSDNYASSSYQSEYQYYA